MHINKPSQLIILPVQKQPTQVLTTIVRSGTCLSMPEVLGVSAELDRRKGWQHRRNRFAVASNQPQQGGTPRG